MTDNVAVLELYNRGISAHDLRSSYVGDQLGDNPYVRFSRQQIEREKIELQGISSLTGREMDGEFFDLCRALDVLEEAESKASEVLSSGQVVGFGLTDAQNLSPKIVPRLEWSFLTMDFERSSACRPEFDYVGLRFVFRDELTEGQVQNLEATINSTEVRRTEVTQSRSLRDLNIAAWENLSLRFLKGNYVEVGGPEKKERHSLAEIGLLNNTTSQPNVSCEILFQMAKHVVVPTTSRLYVQRVSDLRGILQEKFNLDDDPFETHGPQGYIPKFKVVDDRIALDRRAKEKAVHVPFNDERQTDKQELDRDDQDGYSYEEDGETQGDEAFEWLEKYG